MKLGLRVLGVAVAFGHVSASPARVPDDERTTLIDARLSCERARGPGRVLCALSAQPHDRASGDLVWSDALVVRAPSFAPPLRSRVVAPLVSEQGVLSARTRLALVAVSDGVGTVEVLSRSVLCEERALGQRCRPVSVAVRTVIEVGAKDSL